MQREDRQIYIGCKNKGIKGIRVTIYTVNVID